MAFPCYNSALHLSLTHISKMISAVFQPRQLDSLFSSVTAFGGITPKPTLWLCWCGLMSIFVRSFEFQVLSFKWCARPVKELLQVISWWDIIVRLSIQGMLWPSRVLVAYFESGVRKLSTRFLWLPMVKLPDTLSKTSFHHSAHNMGSPNCIQRQNKTKAFQEGAQNP